MNSNFVRKIKQIEFAFFLGNAQTLFTKTCLLMGFVSFYAYIFE
jgi:hypothetical protein